MKIKEGQNDFKHKSSNTNNEILPLSVSYVKQLDQIVSDSFQKVWNKVNMLINEKWEVTQEEVRRRKSIELGWKGKKGRLDLAGRVKVLLPNN